MLTLVDKTVIWSHSVNNSSLILILECFKVKFLHIAHLKSCLNQLCLPHIKCTDFSPTLPL